MKGRAFFSELRRRNVYKVAVAYAVIGWFLIQITSILFTTFEAPGWVMKVFVTVIAAGFPMALIIAWAFEMTPEGMKRTADISPHERIPQWSRRKFAALIVTVGLLAAGLLAFQLWHGKTLTVGNSQPEKSIAVLPFANLSSDPENAYFANGIQDEIITRLSKIAELKVISFASTERFKNRGDDLSAIARQLGVANILEGSVQRTANQVRVNVQLIKAGTDEHLWADTFDRQLTDIFRIESEIATTIAGRLRAKLSGSEQKALATRPTEDTEAYQLYLKGRYFWNKRTGEDIRIALDYFQKAIDKDPSFAAAYAGLADSYVLLPGFTAEQPQDAFPKARVAAEKALELDSTLAEAHASLAMVLYSYEFEFDRSIAEFKRAIELNPNYATAHHWLADTVLLAEGRFPEAVGETKRALELDPLSVIINADLGAVYVAARRFDEAIVQLRKTLEMDPGFYYTRWNLGQAFEFAGQIDAAIPEYEKAYQLNDDPFVLGLIGHAQAVRGRKGQALEVLAQLQETAKRRYVPAYTFAIVYLGLGNKEEALKWLEKSFADRGFEIAFIKTDQILDPLHSEPRFQKLVANVFTGVGK